MDSVVDYIIRPLYPEEIHLLRDFLYEAIFIPEGVEPLPRDVVDLPELKLYIQDFGKKQDDCCLVVEYDGKVVGAVWQCYWRRRFCKRQNYSRLRACA